MRKEAIVKDSYIKLILDIPCPICGGEVENHIDLSGPPNIPSPEYIVCLKCSFRVSEEDWIKFINK